jgi:hypothetical protein
MTRFFFNFYRTRVVQNYSIHRKCPTVCGGAGRYHRGGYGVCRLRVAYLGRCGTVSKGARWELQPQQARCRKRNPRGRHADPHRSAHPFSRAVLGQRRVQVSTADSLWRWLPSCCPCVLLISNDDDACSCPTWILIVGVGKGKLS